MKGRTVPLSVPRRLIVEHCQLALGVPRGALAGELALGALVAARAAHPARPPWTAIFAKAHALAAATLPELRRVYVKLPWPQLYELPASTAAIVIEREFGGEPALFYIRIKRPELLELAAIGAQIRQAQQAAVRDVPDWQAALRVAELPLPLRRAAFFLGRNLGRQVPTRFGTFGISAVGHADIAFTIAVTHWTSFLTYGRLGADGRLPVHFTFDHRVLDGAAAAHAFDLLRAALAGPVLAELQAGAPVAVA